MESVITESYILERVHAKVQQRFTAVDDLAHGGEHVDRVYRLALHIAEQEGADHFITGMAAFMHDLGRIAPPDDGKHHADLSIHYAGEIMQKYHELTNSDLHP